MLRKKANPNVTNPLRVINEYISYGGETPLQLAVANSDAETYRILRRYDASTQVHNDDNETLLHIAIRAEGYDLIPYIIKDKVDVNALDKEGRSALMLFLNNEAFSFDPDDPEREEMLLATLKALVAGGATRQQKPLEGNNPVTLAQEHPRLKAYLLEQGF